MAISSPTTVLIISCLYVKLYQVVHPKHLKSNMSLENFHIWWQSAVSWSHALVFWLWVSFWCTHRFLIINIWIVIESVVISEYSTLQPIWKSYVDLFQSDLNINVLLMDLIFWYCLECCAYVMILLYIYIFY